MKLLILRRIGPDFGRGVSGVGIRPLPAGAIALRPEAPEPDAGFAARAAAHQADGTGPEVDAEDFRDAPEILIDGIIPVVIEAALAIPGARLVLRRIG